MVSFVSFDGLSINVYNNDVKCISLKNINLSCINHSCAINAAKNSLFISTNLPFGVFNFTPFIWNVVSFYRAYAAVGK